MLTAEPQCWLTLNDSNNEPGCSLTGLGQSHGANARQDHWLLHRSVKAQGSKYYILLSWLIKRGRRLFSNCSFISSLLSLPYKMSHWDGQLSFLTDRLPSRGSRLSPTLPRVILCSFCYIFLGTFTLLLSLPMLMCFQMGTASLTEGFGFYHVIILLYIRYFRVLVSMFYSLHSYTYQMRDWCYISQLLSSPW